MFAKIDVNGDDAHPLFRFLKGEAPGVLGTESIKWNFTKFLINKDGAVFKRYAPQTKPEELERDIEILLAR
jgi:glutathione peroxidase